MKTYLSIALSAILLCACSGGSDDYSIDYFYNTYGGEQGGITGDTLNVRIVFNGATVALSGDTDAIGVTTQGAHVTVNSTTTSQFLQLTLSGQTTDGSLLVYSVRKWGLVLDGVSILNPGGPAVNNQCGKSLYLTLAEGTDNTLADGATYGEAPLDAAGLPIDQKGTLFSEGQIFIGGQGTLNVTGNAKNGIASDDYLVMESGHVGIDVAATGTNGIKVNDGFTMSGGTLSIDVKANGARGIKNDARTTFLGGTTTISTSGNCLIETTGGVADTTTCAGIKCDSLFTMRAGTLSINSTGDGGKGINCADSLVLSGGTMTVGTTGGNVQGKPKAVKSDKGIFLAGGTFRATCLKSWACDNGSDSEVPADRVAISGTPTATTLTKRQVVVSFE